MTCPRPAMAGEVTVEVLTAGGCPRCGKVVERVRDAVDALGDERVHYRERDVVDEIDYAVKLGVRRTPAVVLNGTLLAEAPPTNAQLRRAVRRHLEQKEKT